MSRKLDSILATVPPATARRVGSAQDYQFSLKKEEIAIEKAQQKLERLVAEIPFYLKREIKLYLADHPKETERSLILRGLKALGFHINEGELADKRGNNK